MLKLKLLECWLCLIQVYDSKSSALYPEFAVETSDALRDSERQ